MNLLHLTIAKLELILRRIFLYPLYPLIIKLVQQILATQIVLSPNLFLFLPIVFPSKSYLSYSNLSTKASISPFKASIAFRLPYASAREIALLNASCIASFFFEKYLFFHVIFLTLNLYSFQ